MLTGSRSPQSTDLFAVGCGRCCAGKCTDRVKDDAYAITNNGRTPSSLTLGCSRRLRPIAWRANPDVETTNWRARRGRTAQRVRREGTVTAVSYRYPLARSRRTPHFVGHLQPLGPSTTPSYLGLCTKYREFGRARGVMAPEFARPVSSVSVAQDVERPELLGRRSWYPESPLMGGPNEDPRAATRSATTTSQSQHPRWGRIYSDVASAKWVKMQATLTVRYA